ncbi:HK97 family phage prohead protease [Roseibium sp. RKSG952]|uniref:HK97 family phage prohead protease n=1 Tax=Roseibium sp. RKSG952 TaxID=2529384 RepID=UPI0012BBD13C|nr:HK97 family phage prohead protease [Roseibium sp. RKSG952]MTH95857.1 HK97 family phage prohead protease [Roseibium sp. RKSG952]
MADLETDGLWVTGYASLFAQPDCGGDIVRRGAFSKSLTGRRCVAMLWQHDAHQPIGTWRELREDASGLRVLGKLNPGVARAREAAALLNSGDLTGLSIGFRALKARRTRSGRELIAIDLWEISLVTFPQAAKARARLVGIASRRQG